LAIFSIIPWILLSAASIGPFVWDDKEMTYEVEFYFIFLSRIVTSFQLGHMLWSDLSLRSCFYPLWEVVDCSYLFGVTFPMISIPQIEKSHREVSVERKVGGWCCKSTYIWRLWHLL